MKVNRKTLQTALERVRPGLSKGDTIEQSTAFAFLNGRVVTYNDEISVSHPVEELKDITGAIEAEKLYAFLSKTSNEEVELSLNEKGEIVIKAGRSRAGFTLQAEVKLPLEEGMGQKGKWKPLPTNFTKAVSFCLSSPGNDMNRPVLTCIHVQKSGYVEGSDGYRIARYMLDAEMPVSSFLIPVSSAAELVKLNPTRVAEGEGWIHFRTAEKTEFSCRTFADAYVNTVPFLKVEGTPLTLPKEVPDTLGRANIFARREKLSEETIEIRIEKGVLKMKSEDETGWFEEEVAMDYKGSPLLFRVAPYLLRNILSETLACTLGEKRIKFEGEGWTFVALLKEK